MTTPHRHCPQCGELADQRLAVRYSYPRSTPVADAMDPFYVHGSDYIDTCGSPACEAVELTVARDRIKSVALEFEGRILGDDELHTDLVRPDLIVIVDEPDGSVRESWPTPPGG